MAEAKREKTTTWRLVTNYQNMLVMLESGLVTSPAGFSVRHYSDSLSDCPGWITLFRDDRPLPADVLEYVTSARWHLEPCIATLDLTGAASAPFTVATWIMAQDGSLRDTALPVEDLRDDDLALMVPAPLPSATVTNIAFWSDDNWASFEERRRLWTNVPQSHPMTEVSKEAFAADANVKARPLIQMPGERFPDHARRHDRFPCAGQAVGGVLAMLYHMAQRGELGLCAYRATTGSAKDTATVKDDMVLADLPCFAATGAAMPDNGSVMFWGTVQSLVEAHARKDFEQPMDAVLRYLSGLDNQIFLARGPVVTRAFQLLREDMSGCLGFGEPSITELLERHPLTRALLLLGLRESCAELLDLAHPLLEESDFVRAAILFGARDGWQQIPPQFRTRELSNWVSHRMANAEHAIMDTGISFAEPPIPELPAVPDASPQMEFAP